MLLRDKEIGSSTTRTAAGNLLEEGDLRLQADDLVVRLGILGSLQESDKHSASHEPACLQITVRHERETANHAHTKAYMSMSDTSKLEELTVCRRLTIARHAVRILNADKQDWLPGLAYGS